MPANSLTTRVLGRIGLRGRDGEMDVERDAGVEAGMPAIPLQVLAAANHHSAVVFPPITTFKTATTTLLHTQPANERFRIKLAFLPQIETGVATTSQHIARLQSDYNERVCAAKIAANMRYLEVLQYGPGGRDSVIGRGLAVEQRREWEAGCVEWALFPAKRFWVGVLFVVSLFCGFCGN